MSETTTPVVENFNFDLPKNRSNVIKVIGIGGGGGNAINYMFQQGIMGVDFVICNTDSQALEKSGVPIKIQLGASLTEGLGAGPIPMLGVEQHKKVSRILPPYFLPKLKWYLLQLVWVVVLEQVQHQLLLKWRKKWTF